MIVTPTRDHPRARRLLGIAANVSGPALLGINILALIGFLVRDRHVAIALMLYIPLLPVGLVAMLLDLARRGRALGRPRFLLTAVGVLAIACSVFTMVGRGPETSQAAEAALGEPVRLLHWNVVWGGIPRTVASWRSIEDAIIERHPDILVLSEAPHDDNLQLLTRRLGPA
jgi:hypothetical protein